MQQTPTHVTGYLAARLFRESVIQANDVDAWVDDANHVTWWKRPQNHMSKIWDEYFIVKLPTLHPLWRKEAEALKAVKGWINIPDKPTLTAPVNPNAPVTPKPDQGAKYDTGKAMWGLLFTGCRNTLRGIVAVLNYGAMKYPKPPMFNSWRDVPDATKRYHEAFLRHSNELDGIEGLFKLDEESGLPAIDHVITNLIFIRELNQSQIMQNIAAWNPPPEGSNGFDLERTLTAQNICTENERLTKGI